MVVTIEFHEADRDEKLKGVVKCIRNEYQADLMVGNSPNVLKLIIMDQIYKEPMTMTMVPNSELQKWKNAVNQAGNVLIENRRVNKLNKRLQARLKNA